MINGETKEGREEGRKEGRRKGEKKEEGRKKERWPCHSPCRIINKLKGDSNVRPHPSASASAHNSRKMKSEERKHA